MPYLDDEDIRRISGMKDGAEYELDLCGLDLPHSLASVERMIERSRFRKPRSVAIRIYPATATSGETHFQPIGRLLVEAMKAGTVRQTRPLMEAGAGFWVSLTGNPNADETEPGEEVPDTDQAEDP
ncbi:MAG: hypothetical protein GKS01_16580 [Alphaproteobacteria bacterium]|nr:hypothetical protein [Alphaproteobacteria bacterium]